MTIGGFATRVVVLLALLWAVFGSQAGAIDLMREQVRKSDIEDKSCEALSIMRNEIFARHGREFGNPKLREYFLEKKWYVPEHEPTSFPSENLITPLQYKNIQYIKHFEDEKQCSNPKSVFEFSQWGILQWSAALGALAVIVTFLGGTYRFLRGRPRADADPPE